MHVFFLIIYLNMCAMQCGNSSTASTRFSANMKKTTKAKTKNDPKNVEEKDKTKNGTTKSVRVCGRCTI